MRFTKLIFVLFLAVLFYPVLIAAQTSEEFVLSADKLADGKTVELHKERWKYQAGDDMSWAAGDFDDSGWKSLTNDEINSNPAAIDNRYKMPQLYQSPRTVRFGFRLLF